MISLLFERAVIYPVVVCDWCGKRIQGDGNMLYQPPPLTEIKDQAFTHTPAQMAHTHKHCNRAFEKANPCPNSLDGRWWWNDLDEHLMQLLNNTALDNADAKKVYALLEKARTRRNRRRWGGERKKAGPLDGPPSLPNPQPPHQPVEETA